jgi:hypothetical protein
VVKEIFNHRRVPDKKRRTTGADLWVFRKDSVLAIHLDPFVDFFAINCRVCAFAVQRFGGA